MTIFRNSPLAGGFRKSSFSPANLSGLSAWYTASSLVTSPIDPGSLSGVVSRFRADDFVNGTDPGSISGLVAHYRSDTGVTLAPGLPVLPWNIDNTDTFVSGQTDPLGGTAAYKFQESSATSTHTFYAYPNGTSDVGGTVVTTISLKTSGHQWVQIVLTVLNSAAIWFDTINGVVGTVTQGANGTVSTSVTPQGNGWFQLTLTQTVTTPLLWNISYTRIYLAASDGANASSYAGNGSNGILIYNPAQTMTIGQGVASWADSISGGTHNLLAPSAAGAPGLKQVDSAYNGTPSLTFISANTQFLASAAWSSPLASPMTICIIGNDDGTATQQVYTELQQGAANDVTLQAFGGVYSMYSTPTLLNSTVANTSAPRIMTGVFNGASSSLYSNTNTTIATGTVGTSALTGLTVGGATAANVTLNGKVVEVCIFSRALSDAEVKAITYYAANRYKLGIKIGIWKDSVSGDATHNATQSTYASQPTLTVASGSYNSQPVLNFASASTQNLKSSVWTSALTTHSIVVVGNFDAALNNEYFVDGTTLNESVIYNDIANAVVAMYGGTTLLVGTATVATPQIVIANFNAGSSTLYASGNSSVAGSSGTASLHGLTIGSAASATACLNGNIAEVIVFNRVITPSEAAGINAYASARYGIALKIGAWADSAAPHDSTHDTTQATYTKQPTLILADPLYNLKPMLSFNAAAQQTLASGLWSTHFASPYTIAAVYNSDAGVPQQLVVFGYNGGTDEYELNATDGTGGTPSIYSGSFLQKAATADANRHASLGIYGTSGKVYDSAKTAAATGSSGTNGMQDISIGAVSVAAGGGGWLNGKIAEIVIYNRALSQSEVEQILSYLGNKFNISIGA